MSYFKELWNSIFHEPGCNPSERLPDGTNAVDPKVWKNIQAALDKEEKNKKKKKDKPNGIS